MKKINNINDWNELGNWYKPELDFQELKQRIKQMKRIQKLKIKQIKKGNYI